MTIETLTVDLRWSTGLKVGAALKEQGYMVKAMPDQAGGGTALEGFGRGAPEATKPQQRGRWAFLSLREVSISGRSGGLAPEEHRPLTFSIGMPVCLISGKVFWWVRRV